MHSHITAYRQELLRVCPEAAEAERIDLPDDILPVEILGVLRTLPNGSGLERLYQALAEHRARKQRRDSTGVQPKK
jgi:hypothetical protein